MGTHFSFSATLLIIMTSTSKVMAQAIIVLGCLTTLALARWEATSYPWQAKCDHTNNNRTFYVNHATKVTQWEQPPANEWRIGVVNGPNGSNVRVQMNWVDDIVPSVDSSSDENECEVCMARQISTTCYFLCGHRNCCDDCATTILKGPRPICPVCRAAPIRQRRLLSM